MSFFEAVALSFAIGLIAGLRALTAPAVTSWALYLRWISVSTAWLSWLGSSVAVAIFTLLAIIELIGDKLPSTPNRTAAEGLIARVLLGGLSGACVAVAGLQSAVAGVALGAIGGVIGAFAGYEGRRRLVKSLEAPDFVIALAEDLVAVLGGLLIVSRY